MGDYLDEQERVLLDGFEELLEHVLDELPQIDRCSILGR